jgi:hypothetical protein
MGKLFDALMSLIQLQRYPGTAHVALERTASTSAILASRRKN